MKKVLKISGLDCPVCAEALESDIRKIKGVASVQVEYVTQTITLEYDGEDALKKAIKTANHFEEVQVLEEGSSARKEETHRKEWLQIGVSATLLILGVLFDYAFSFAGAAYIAYVFYGGAYFAVGYPVLLSTAKNIAKGRIFDENFLMTVASVGAVALGEVLEGVAVMLLYQLGETLQALAVGSSRKSVARLMELKSERAVLLADGEQKEVEPEALRVGDILLVKAGEKTPADGELLSETAVLDVKSLTGEAELKGVKKGEEILSGSINAGGTYEMKVVRPYAESAVGRILDMVENAAAGKAQPEKFIARFAKFYTPIVCAAALLLALVAPLIGGLIVDGRAYFYEFPRFARSALTFLVISCPCALVISVPLTYFSGIGACARQGILVKGATYLDVVAKAKTVAFDKTGTLTEGDFTVREVIPAQGVSKEEVLSLAAAVERGSAHPIAKAFSTLKTEWKAEEIFEVAGKGLKAKIGGASVLVGGEKLLAESGISPPKIESVYTLVYVAREGEYVGVIEIGDRLRAEAKESVQAIRAQGIAYVVMWTGDNEKRARFVANEVGAYEVNAELLPDEKLRKAEEWKKKGGLIYVGDGVNDAPVMMTADCAVSMGKLGSAAAVEAADMVLIADDLRVLPKGIKIAKKTRKIVFQNIAFSIAMKVAFMALGGVGILPLWLAVFADVGVMLLAVLNSFRVRRLS